MDVTTGKATVRQLRALAIERFSQIQPEELQYGGAFQTLYFRAVRSGGAFGLVVSDVGSSVQGNRFDYIVCADDGRVLRVSSFAMVYKIAAEIVGNHPDVLSGYSLWLGLVADEFEQYQPRQVVTEGDKAREVSRLKKVQGRQAAAIADIDAQLAAMVGWESLNAAHAAKKAGLIERRALIVADGALVAARIAELAP